MKITVEQGACVGSGQCVYAAPEVFDQRDSDGIVVLLDDAPDARLHEDVEDAARICPAQAIALS
ncbi:ferredoxin [Nonomuraea typhae]|uniref:Ferredoxin n=1 Tax=Nonomuraea typhae TaxID=2603600 RepID=A0ABW7Z3T0_9ACTN|nr:ferredoxin [Nonomuraea typhae]